MDEANRKAVRKRAANRCEFCLLHQDDSPLAALHIEHIIAKKHGGSEKPSNLASVLRALRVLRGEKRR